MSVRKRNPRLSEFNGKIFIDPDVKAEDIATLDADYAGPTKVYVHSFNSLFATVSTTKGSPTWAVMRNRLTKENV